MESWSDSVMQFVRNTWAAWRTDAISELGSHYGKAAALPLDAFMAKSLQDASIKEILKMFVPNRDEFLLAYGERHHFFLTNERIFVLNKGTQIYSEFDLRELNRLS